MGVSAARALPDIVAFSKKVQLGGIMAGGRVDEVADNVFAVSGRINSTWGGGLTDMVRSRRILEIVEREGLIEAAGPKGEALLAALGKVEAAHPALLSNVRGRGLLVAVDVPDSETRDVVLGGCGKGTCSPSAAVSGRFDSGRPCPSPSTSSSRRPMPWAGCSTVWSPADEQIRHVGHRRGTCCGRADDL